MKLMPAVIAVALLAMAAYAAAEGCVDVFFEVPAVVHPGDVVAISGGITNCGDMPGIAYIEASLSYEGEVIGSTEGTVPLAAGETKSFELTDLEVPMNVFPGTYEICVTATLDGGTDTQCSTVEVVESGTKAQPKVKSLRLR